MQKQRISKLKQLQNKLKQLNKTIMYKVIMDKTNMNEVIKNTIITIE